MTKFPLTNLLFNAFTNLFAPLFLKHGGLSMAQLRAKPPQSIVPSQRVRLFVLTVLTIYKNNFQRKERVMNSRTITYWSLSGFNCMGALAGHVLSCSQNKLRMKHSMINSHRAHRKRNEVIGKQQRVTASATNSGYQDRTANVLGTELP